jgi:hypothetical protein
VMPARGGAGTSNGSVSFFKYPDSADRRTIAAEVIA